MGERDKAKEEQRKRLAEALRANLKRRKAGRTGEPPEAPTPQTPAPESSRPEPPNGED